MSMIVRRALQLRLLKRASVLALACALPSAALAQVPRPGSIEPPSRPPVTIEPLAVPPAVRPQTPAGGPSFVLRKLRFAGASVIDEARLQALAAPYIGQAVTLSDLEAIAQRATELYQADGYLLAQAVVPAQDVTSGDVEISVLEGRLGRVQIEVDDAAPIDEARVRSIVDRLPAGRPLRQAELTRVMLLLADLPGVRVQAALEAGEAPGSTDLLLGVLPGRSHELAIDADNHGSRAVSEYRIGVQGRWNSPLRAGDNLDYRLQVGSGGRLAFGRLGYERPLGGNGLRLSLAASLLDYALGGDFAALDATGRAKVLEIGLAYPLVRARETNLLAKLTLQRKLLEDRFGAGIDTRPRRRMTAAETSLAFEHSDGWLGGGYSSAGASLVVGELDLDAAAAQADARRTGGGFTHLNYNLSRLNVLVGRTHLFVGLAGQFADKNLDSIEKVSLGGPRGVRAYAPSEITADEAHILNAELRYSATPALSLQAFYDWGWAKRNERPDPQFDTDNRVHLRGHGIGVFWSARTGLSLRASLAWRDARPGETDRRDPRLYLQASQPL